MFALNLKVVAIVVAGLVAGYEVHDQFHGLKNVHPIAEIQGSVRHLREEAAARKKKYAMVKLLTDTVWCEDRSDIKSMSLVLSVIHNRAKTKDLAGLHEQAKKKWQFSCNNSPDILASQKRSRLDDKRYKEAGKLVRLYLAGKFVPITEATFYYVAKQIEKPKYLNSRKLVLVYKKHHYYS